MHNFRITQAAVLALLATSTVAAPASFFPGVAFHGVPESHPSTWAWNATKPTPDGPPGPPAFDKYKPESHGHDDKKRSLGLDFIKLEKYSKAQLEELHNALEHNHTLPALDLSPTDLAHHRPNLLAAVESFLRSHFHKRNSIDIEFEHLSHAQLEALHSAVYHNHTLPSLNLTESVLKHEKSALLALLEKFIHPTPLGKGFKARSLEKKTPWIQSSHPFIPAFNGNTEIPALAPTSAKSDGPTGFITKTTANTRAASAIRAAIHSEIGSVASAISAVQTVLPTGVLKSIENDVLELKKGLPTGLRQRVKRGDEVVKRSVTLVGSPVSFPLPTSAPTNGVYLS